MAEFSSTSGGAVARTSANIGSAQAKLVDLESKLIQVSQEKSDDEDAAKKEIEWLNDQLKVLEEAYHKADAEKRETISRTQKEVEDMTAELRQLEVKLASGGGVGSGRSLDHAERAEAWAAVAHELRVVRHMVDPHLTEEEQLTLTTQNNEAALVQQAMDDVAYVSEASGRMLALQHLQAQELEDARAPVADPRDGEIEELRTQVTALQDALLQEQGCRAAAEAEVQSLVKESSEDRRTMGRQMGELQRVLKQLKIEKEEYYFQSTNDKEMTERILRDLEDSFQNILEQREGSIAEAEAAQHQLGGELSELHAALQAARSEKGSLQEQIKANERTHLHVQETLEVEMASLMREKTQLEAELEMLKRHPKS